MRTNRILLITVLVFSFCSQGVAQLNRANKNFEYFRYSQAIPLYQKVILSGNKQEIGEATQRLADCYRLINDAAKASIWYEKAISVEGAGPKNYWYLGQALRSLERYSEAANAFKQYSQLVPDDPQGEIYYNFCIRIQEWENLPETAEVKNLASVNTKYSEFCPSLYKNGIVFTSDRITDPLDNQTFGWTNFNYLDLYYSEPEYTGNYWDLTSEPVSMVGNFNQSYHDGPASFSKEGTLVFITKTITDRGKIESANLRTHLLKLFYSDIIDDKIIKYKPFPFNSEEYSVGHASLSPGNRFLVFSSDKPGGYGGSDLYLCEFSNGGWKGPVNLGAVVNSPGNEVFPYFYNDSTIYFSSDGHLGFGGLDIFRITLSNHEWSTPENLKKPINSSYDDFGIIFTSNETAGLFSSNRAEGKGSDDIYAFRSLKFEKEECPENPLPENSQLALSGYVKNWMDKKPLEGATVFLLNTANGKVQILKSDSAGLYKTAADKGVLYVSKALKTGYIDDCISFRTPDGEGTTTFTPEDLLLGKLEADQIFRVENIYYDLDKWDIRPDAVPALKELSEILNNYPIRVELSSHTDSRASSGYNLELSEKRAKAAVDFLISLGVSPSKLVAKGYGESKLVNRCSDGVVCSEEEHQANRRTEFKILSVDTVKGNPPKFDLSVFKDGDHLDLQLFDAGFFRNCIGKTGNQSGNIFGANLLPAEKPVTGSPAPAGNSENAVVSQPATPDFWYAVQVMAAKVQAGVQSPAFKNESGIYELQAGGYYKYFSGKYTDYIDAVAERERLKRLFPGAFIVKISGGRPIPANQGPL